MLYTLFNKMLSLKLTMHTGLAIYVVAKVNNAYWIGHLCCR